MDTGLSALSDEELWRLAHKIAKSHSSTFDISVAPDVVAVALTIEMVQGIVDNGGIEYLLGPDLPLGLDYGEIVRACKVIESWLCAEALEEVLRAFPGGIPPLSMHDREVSLEKIVAMRRDLLDQASRTFWDCSESNYAAALRLLRAHPEVLVAAS